MLVDGDGTVVETGGLELILRLRRGEYGKANTNTPFFVLTGQKPSLDEQVLFNIPGCLGVEKKLLQHRLLSKIRATIDEKESGG